MEHWRLSRFLPFSKVEVNFAVAKGIIPYMITAGNKEKVPKSFKSMISHTSECGGRAAA